MTTPAFDVICTQEDRPEWLAQRRGGIGGSDAPTILGINKFSSPHAIWLEKSGTKPLSDDDEQEINDAMYWGNVLEPVVAAEYAKETGRKVTRNGQMVQSKTHPFMRATLDGEIYDPHWHEQSGTGLLECKTTSRTGEWDDGIPDYVYAQVQHCMHVTGYSWAGVAVLMNGRQFFRKDIGRNDEWIHEVLIPAEQQFWQHVLDLTPPPTDASESCAKALASIHGAGNGDVVELDGKFVAVDERIQQMAEEMKALESETSLLKNEVRAAIGRASVGLLPNGVKYHWKHQRTRKEKKCPACDYVLEDEKGTRVLRPYRPKKKD